MPPLSVTEVESRLEVLGAAFAEAAADGLDAGECSSLVAGYQALYDRDTRVMAARFNVAAVHEACGAPEKAESIYTELGKRGYAPALNNLGVLAWQAGDHKRAFELFEHSVAADQTHALAARNNLAMALRERYATNVDARDFDRAEHELQNVLAVESGNRAAYENLARLYYDRGRLDDPAYLVLANLVVTQAQRVLAAKHEQSADLANIRGLLLMQDNDQVHALRAFQQAAEVDPKHADANRNIAMIAIRFRDYGTAEQAIERVIDEDAVADDVEAWIALGVAKRGLRKYDEADKAYRHALDVDRKDPRPWYNLGVMAQDHLVANVAGDDEALNSLYAKARGDYQTFIDGASGRPELAEAVADAKDRIVIIDDTIETIAKMKELEKAMIELERKAALEKQAEIERLLALEAQGQSSEAEEAQD